MFSDSYLRIKKKNLIVLFHFGEKIVEINATHNFQEPNVSSSETLRIQEKQEAVSSVIKPSATRGAGASTSDAAGLQTTQHGDKKRLFILFYYKTDKTQRWLIRSDSCSDWSPSHFTVWMKKNIHISTFFFPSVVWTSHTRHLELKPLSLWLSVLNTAVFRARTNADIWDGGAVWRWRAGKVAPTRGTRNQSNNQSWKQCREQRLPPTELWDRHKIYGFFTFSPPKC